MTPDKWQGCTNIQQMLDHLRQEGCWQALWTFSVMCSHRIGDQLPSEMSNEALEEFRNCKSGELNAKLSELEPALAREMKHYHARMVMGRHETQYHSMRATNDYLSIEVLILLFENSRDLTGGGETVVAEAVADVAANRDLIRSGQCDSAVEQFRREFDLFRHQELRRQVDLLRSIQPIPPNSLSNSAAPIHSDQY